MGWQRTYDITVAGNSFSFPMYGDRVGVNVKFHGEAEIRDPALRPKWDALPDRDKQRLLEWAREITSETWWDDRRAQLPLDVECDGRSGGYLVFPERSTRWFGELEYDLESERCTICDHEGGHEAHRQDEQMFARETRPLPFGNAPWDLKCENCGDLYESHVGGRCSFLLGVNYKPHPYLSPTLETLRELQNCVDLVTRAANHEALQDWANSDLESQLEIYLEGLTEAGTDSEP